MRIANALAALASAVALAGCCNGPFAYVDCVASAIHVDVVDPLGAEAAVDLVRYRIDGGAQLEAWCTEQDTTDGCATWWVDAYEEGTYAIEVVVDDQVVATDTVEVVTPEKKRGECCSEVFRADVSIEVRTAS